MFNCIIDNHCNVPFGDFENVHGSVGTALYLLQCRYRFDDNISDKKSHDLAIWMIKSKIVIVRTCK